MSYLVKGKESDVKAEYAGITQKILKILKEQRAMKYDDSLRRRWVWELLQNAKDSIDDDKQVSIQVILHRTPQNKLEFKHNGKPFSVCDITFLIKQESTKEKSKDFDQENMKPTGKFGTGFMTTHLLSEQVTIYGIVKENDEPYREFEIPLDRSGQTVDEIMERVTESIKIRDKLDDGRIVENYNEHGFNTTFSYILDDMGLSVAETGIADLHRLIPFTLAFNRKIKVVEILPENITYELIDDHLASRDEHIKLVTIRRTTNTSPKDIYIALLSKGSVTIAIEIQKQDDKKDINEDDHKYIINEMSPKIPHLFCDFPLIGTEDFFDFPVIVNSSAFNLTDSRDGVFLTGSSADKELPDITQNKTIILEAVSLYYILLEYASTHDWQNIYLLAKTALPEGKKWLSREWYEKEIQKPIRAKLLNVPIVDHEKKKRIPIELVEGGYVDFPSAKTKELRESIWELCNCDEYFILPLKKHIHDWNDICWDETYRLNTEVLMKHIAKQKNISALSTEINKTEIETIQWLNQFYDVVTIEGSNLKLINEDRVEYIVIPNQNGIFTAKSKLYHDEDIDETLKNILKELGYDYKEFLVLKGIDTGKGISYPTKTQEDIARDISKKITPLFTEMTKSEKTKQIFAELFLWFNENSEEAECFGDLYTNRHKLRNDEDIIADMKFKQTILDNNVNKYSEDELIEIIKTPNIKAIIDQVNTTPELVEIITALTTNPILHQSAVLDLIRQTIEDNTDESNNLTQLGREAENILESVFSKEEGFNIQKVHVGRDFVLTIQGSDIEYSIELKSTKSTSVLMSIEQGKKAVSSPDKYALCVVKRDGDIDETFFKQNAKFVIDIGHQLHDKVVEASKIVGLNRYYGHDIQIEIEGNLQIKFRVHERLWGVGESFDAFMKYLKSSIFLP